MDGISEIYLPTIPKEFFDFLALMDEYMKQLCGVQIKEQTWTEFQ